MTSGRFFVSLTLLCLLATSAFATSARVNALGGGGAFLEDDDNLQRWYGSLVDYPDRVILDSGHFSINYGYHAEGSDQRLSGPWGLAAVGLDRWKIPGVLSIGLYGAGDDADSGGLYRDALRTTWAVMYGVDIKGVAATLIYRSGSDNRSETDGLATWTWDRSRHDLGLGFRFDLSDGAYLDVAGEFRAADEDIALSPLPIDPPPAISTPSHSLFDSWNLRARAFIRLGESTALVPVVEVFRDDRPAFVVSPFHQRHIDGRDLMLGAGLNWYPDPDHLLVLSANYSGGEVDDIYYGLDPGQPAIIHAEWNALRARLALESVFLSWVTVRTGLVYDLRSETLHGVDETFAGLNLAGGVALHAGDWDFDLSVNDGEPRAFSGYLGPYNRSSYGTWLQMSLRRQF